MKKHLLFPLLGFFALYIQSFSQTVTPSYTLIASNAHFVANEKFILKKCAYTPVFGPGMNQNWNYSSLAPTSTSTITIKDQPFTLPGGTWCASCNFAMIEAPSGTTSFVDNVSGDLLLYRKGIDPNWVDLIVPEILLPMPFQYGDTTISNWSTSGSLKKGTSIITADGTGNLITPAGTFTNTLRIHFNKVSRDSVSATNITTYLEEVYKWYISGVHYPLLTISSLTVSSSITGTSPPVEYSQYLFDPYKTTGIYSNVITPEFISIYPNPSSEKIIVQLNLKDNVPVTISVFNVNGQKMAATVSSEYSTSIDVSSLAKGMYFVEVSSGSRILKKERLILNN